MLDTLEGQQLARRRRILRKPFLNWYLGCCRQGERRVVVHESGVDVLAAQCVGDRKYGSVVLAVPVTGQNGRLVHSQKPLIEQLSDRLGSTAHQCGRRSRQRGNGGRWTLILSGRRGGLINLDRGVGGFGR